MSVVSCNHSYSFNCFMSHDPSMHDFSTYRRSPFYKNLKKVADGFVGGNFPLVLCDEIIKFTGTRILESNCTLCRFNKKISEIMLLGWDLYCRQIRYIYFNLIRNHGKGKDGNQDEVFFKCYYLHTLNFKYLKKSTKTFMIPEELDKILAKQLLITEVFCERLIHYLKIFSYNNMKKYNITRAYHDQFYVNLAKDLIKKIDFLFSELKNIHGFNKNIARLNLAKTKGYSIFLRFSEEMIEKRSSQKKKILNNACLKQSEKMIKESLFEKKKLLEKILKNQDYIKFEK